jgi:hypothetical protein
MKSERMAAMDHTIADNPPEIETVQERFEAWRSGRANRRELIPQHLWQAAVELCRSHSTSHVSRQLRLSYADLKKRVAQGHLPSVQFVEMDMDTLAGRWQIECNRSDGHRLRIAGSGQPPAADIIRSFLS